MSETFGVMLFLGGLIVLIWIIVKCLRAFSDWRISKNKKKYFELNKKVCVRARKKGKDVLKSTAVYSQYIDMLGFNREIMCSSSVVLNSSQNTIRYLLRYSNLRYDIEDMKRLEYISDYIIERRLFEKAINDARIQIRQNLPLFYRIFANKMMLPYTVCELDYRITTIKEPFLTFVYISPAGKSKRVNRISINIDVIEELVSEISKYIGKTGHSKRQRSIMTNDLREAIKKRDNYTCRKCGNSVYKEPNLLLEVDHIVPISKGGKTEASNLQTLCWRCNREKSDKEEV